MQRYRQSLLVLSNSQFGEVSHGAKSAETLPENAPFLVFFRIVGRQALADGFTVSDNVVRAEMSEVLCLPGSVALEGECFRGDGGAKTCAALVEEEDLFSCSNLGVTNNSGLTSIIVEWCREVTEVKTAV